MNAKTLSPRDREENVEVGLLTVALGLHPEHVGADVLIHRALAADPVPTEEKELEEGLERLKAVELLRELDDGRIAPTQAAVHFGKLPF